MSDKMPETQRDGIAQNPYQGKYKRILCVCSGGILRSPTAAFVLSQEPYNANTRAAGTHTYALIQVDPVLCAWADEIVCMESEHQRFIEKLDVSIQAYYPKHKLPRIICLGIPDIYAYRDPELIARIKRSYEKETK
jgi:predicted protein tyrosine phosphatase